MNVQAKGRVQVKDQVDVQERTGDGLDAKEGLVVTGRVKASGQAP